MSRFAALPVWIGLALSLVVAPVPVGAETPGVADAQRRLDAEDTCKIDLPSWVTPAERFAWDRICAGQPADMSAFAGAADTAGCNPHGPAGSWPAERRLRARFIELVATRRPFVDAPARRIVYVRCAEIAGDLDLQLDVVPQMLRLESNRFTGMVLLGGAHFADGLSLADSNLAPVGPGAPDFVDASFLHLQGSLDLRNTDFGALTLRGSVIDGTVWLDGVIAGSIDAEQIVVGKDLSIVGGAKLGSMMLNTARIGGDLKMRDVRVWNSFAGDGLRVGGAAFIGGNAEIGTLNLNSARIDEDLSVVGLVVTPTVNDFDQRLPRDPGLPDGFEADALLPEPDAAQPTQPATEISDPKLLTDADNPPSASACAAPPSGTEPDVAPADTASAGAPPAGPLPDGAFIGENMTVGGRFFLQGSDIGGTLRLSEARVAKTLMMGGTRVDGVFSAIGLEIGGGLWLDGARFCGPVDFDKARIGELRLLEGDAPVRWGPWASLSLSNADVGVLQARMPDTWQRALRPHETPRDPRADETALEVDLGNFRYDRLVVAPPPDAPQSVPDLDAGPLIDWVRNAVISARGAVVDKPAPKAMQITGQGMQDGGDAAVFVPQPFQQLEETLRRMGADKQAAAVRVAGHLDLMQSYPPDVPGWLRWLADGVWWALVGFGAHPFRVLLWFAVLVGAGVIVARQSRGLRAKGWTGCFWYSLENAFPLLHPSADNEAVAHDTPRMRNFFHFQKVAGFVLATILVGALTLLGG